MEGPWSQISYDPFNKKFQKNLPTINKITIFKRCQCSTKLANQPVLTQPRSLARCYCTVDWHLIVDTGSLISHPIFPIYLSGQLRAPYLTNLSSLFGLYQFLGGQLFFSSLTEEKTMYPSSEPWAPNQNQQIRLFFNTKMVIAHWLIFSSYAEYKEKKTLCQKG